MGGGDTGGRSCPPVKRKTKQAHNNLSAYPTPPRTQNSTTTPLCTVIAFRLGLNLEIKDGKLALLEPFAVCTEGKPITPEQAKLMVRVKACVVCVGGVTRFTLHQTRSHPSIHPYIHKHTA